MSSAPSPRDIRVSRLQRKALETPDEKSITLLRWACAALLFGRAWQHLIWDAPYRALLWSEETMEGAVSFFLGLSWEEYATSPAVAAGIAGFIKFLGAFHLLGGAAALCCYARRGWTHVVLALSSLALVFLAYVTYRDKLYRAGEFLEYASQYALPLLVVLAVRAAISRAGLIRAMQVAVALTFIGHGLYAIRFYPTPGEWITMTMAITGLGDDAAFSVLAIAGVLDLAVAAALFLPWIARTALVYAAVWGLLTALARSVAFVRWENFGESASQWFFETAVRLPHAALPLALLWLLRPEKAAAPLPAEARSIRPCPPHIQQPSTP